MNEQKNEMEIKLVDSNELGIIIRAEMDTQIITAKQYPRSLKIFMDKALSMATLNEDIAASCGYAVPRGSKAMEGKSVRLAEIICSCYGNIRSGARVIANDGKTVT